MKAQDGNRVKVEFVGRLDDGTVFGETKPKQPLEFTLGEGSLITGFEEAVRGMEPGEEKLVQVPPEKAFGSIESAKLVPLDRKRFEQNEPLAAGMRVKVADASGRESIARIENLTRASVTLDFNHPLAGKHLEFKIRLQEVV